MKTTTFSLRRVETVTSRLRKTSAAPIIDSSPSGASGARVRGNCNCSSRSPSLSEKFWIEIRVSFRVFAEMVWSHEPFIADWANEIFLSCMSSYMSGKLIRSGEFFQTSIPSAGKWPFSCVSAKVSLEMGWLPIHFHAARMRTAMVLSFITGFCDPPSHNWRRCG